MVVLLGVTACSGGGTSGSTTGGATTGGTSGSTTGGATSGGTSGGSDPAATSTFSFLSRTAVSVADCPAVTGQTSTWCNDYWPPNADGTVYLYKFTETRVIASTYPTLTRTAYVYRPATITSGSTYPVMVFLHGGTQSGDLMFAKTSFAQLADARGLSTGGSWLQNSASCKEDALGPTSFGLGGASSTGFIDNSGNKCTPSIRKFTRPKAASSFFVVYPNGVTDVDGGGGSWEDGRSPSPGQYDASNPSDPKRDDVGFVNVLIETVKSQETAVDATRVYVGGISNGGIMTHRILCNAGNSNYSQLAQVAAFSVSISSMADNIYRGTNNREQCPTSVATPTSLVMFVGYDAPTPNSSGQAFVANCNPYNPSDPPYPNQEACPYPTVSGDGTMPYGNAYQTGGGVFTVNSQTIGNVIASWDDQNFWLNFINGSGGGNSVETSTALGYFTHLRRYTFARSSAVLQVYEVDHGLHGNGGTRFDYSAAARIYDFLFEFSKNEGSVSTVGGTYVPASGIYSNLSGNY